MSIYIGPYLQCKNQLVDADHVVGHACPNVECNLYGNDTTHAYTFCPKCGSKIGVVHRKVKALAVDQFDIDIDEALSCVSDACLTPPDEKLFCIYEVWIVNRVIEYGGLSSHARPTRNFTIDMPTELSMLNVTTTMIEAELLWFTENYRQELDVMIKQYGDSNVKLRWGVVYLSY